MQEIVLGGVRFRLERINEKHTIAVPVDDPHWMSRELEKCCYNLGTERSRKWLSKMKLSDKVVNDFVVAKDQYDTHKAAALALVREQVQAIATEYPNVTEEEVRQLMEGNPT